MKEVYKISDDIKVFVSPVGNQFKYQAKVFVRKAP